MYYVYVIRSRIRKYFYVGLTNDLQRRIFEHMEGKSRTTRAYRPFVLVCSELYVDRKDARKREKYLKSGVGKEWLKINFD